MNKKIKEILKLLFIPSKKSIGFWIVWMGSFWLIRNLFSNQTIFDFIAGIGVPLFGLLLMEGEL